MSGGRPMTEAARIMRTYYCHYCGAPAGEACLTKAGRKSGTEHGARWQQAVADGKLPLRGGPMDPDDMRDTMREAIP